MISRPVYLRVKPPSGAPRPYFYYCQLREALSDKRTGVLFKIIAGPRQRSHSCVRVSRDSWPYFTVSDSRLPQPGGPSSRIYIPHEQGGPVIPPGTRFPFRRLLRLAGLRWRYSNPHPRGSNQQLEFTTPLNFSTGGNKV
jgi:hypothetical protein